MIGLKFNDLRVLSMFGVYNQSQCYQKIQYSKTYLMGKRSKRRLAKKRLQRHENKKERTRHFKKAPMFRDNFGRDIYSYELVFPIVRMSSNGDFITVGTGFFIHPAGGFVTAKHCLYIGDKYDENCYAIQTFSKGQHIIRKIQYFEAHPKADIGVGMLKGKLKNNITQEEVLKASFVISSQEIKINDAIYTLAFPRMRISESKVGTFPCDKFEGQVTEYLENGTSKVKDECYVTNMFIGTMASGGPVLRENKLIAVNSSAMDFFDNSEVPISFITPISKIFELTLLDSDGKKTSIRELMEAGFMPYAK